MATSTTLHRTLTLGAGLALAVTLTACGGDTATDAPGDATTADVSETPSPSGLGDASPTEAGSPSPTDAGEVDLGAAEAAVTTATGELAGSQAYELDLADDDSSWEVDVTDGTEAMTVRVSADGATVESSEQATLDDDASQVSGAEIDILQAMRIALGQQDGEVTDVDLNDDDGTVAWDVTVRGQDDTDYDVEIDAATGEILDDTM